MYNREIMNLVALYGQATMAPIGQWHKWANVMDHNRSWTIEPTEPNKDVVDLEKERLEGIYNKSLEEYCSKYEQRTDGIHYLIRRLYKEQQV